MSLIEGLIAALLFSLSAGSSLQIWSQLSLGVMQEERHQQLADRLDAELAAIDASLRLQSRQLLQPPPCGNTAAALQALLAGRPLAAGIQRQLTVLQAEESVLLNLTVEGLPIRRQRLYLPAALGLCSATAAPVPTPPLPTLPLAAEPVSAEPVLVAPVSAAPPAEG
jgi:hypothetical protein